LVDSVRGITVSLKRGVGKGVLWDPGVIGMEEETERFGRVGSCNYGSIEEEWQERDHFTAGDVGKSEGEF